MVGDGVAGFAEGDWEGEAWREEAREDGLEEGVAVRVGQRRGLVVVREGLDWTVLGRRVGGMGVMKAILGCVGRLAGRLVNGSWRWA